LIGAVLDESHRVLDEFHRVAIWRMMFYIVGDVAPIYFLKIMSQSSSRVFFGSSVADMQSLLQNPAFSLIYFISAILCLFSGNSFWALCLFALCVYSKPDLLWKIQFAYRDVLRRYRLNPVLMTGIALGLLAGVVLGLAFVDPSHGQFFVKTENFMNKVFAPSTSSSSLPLPSAVTGTGGTTGTGNPVIALVMNTLRLMFVMYMLFGIVQVFQAVRQGEEWKDLARTPFFVVLAGTLGDVLVGVIVGPLAN
jgi:hypothetical protein